MNTMNTGSAVNTVHTSSAVVQAFQAINHCPPPSQIFQGRQAILDSMHQFFTQDAGKQKRYVLYGLGGAGKTQIALKFIQESSCFTDRFLVDASNTDTIETSLKNVAATKQAGKSSQDLLNWLASKHEEWLLFLDNADDPEINLNHWFPRCSHGNIIITTRNHSARIHGAYSEVSNMEELDAVALLLKSALCPSSPTNVQLAAEIVKALWYFPLAIVQAGAFIAKSEALNTYLNLFAKNQTKLLKEKPTQTYDNYASAVYTTWEMSFKKLSNQAAMFLQLCSFLHQDDISEDIFARAANYIMKSHNRTQKQSSSNKEMKPEEFLSYFSGPTGDWNSLQFSELTNEIKAYSLINYNTERNSFSIHPLVHSWSQTTLADPELCHSCMKEILGMSIKEIPKKDMELASLRLVSHVDSLVQGIPELITNFAMQYANIYYSAGQYTKAEELEVGEVERCRKYYGEDHPNTLRAMHKLAMTYHQSGRFKEAEQQCIVVLEKRKKILGDDHLDTLWTMHNLALVYDNLHQFKEAEKLYVVVLEKWKKFLGNDHLDTLHAMLSLAITYDSLGQFEKAKKLEIEVLEKRRKLLGDDHLDTLHTMHNLAVSYDNLGQFEEAKKLKIEVLEKQRKLLGDDHPDTLRTMYNLAITYHNLGQFKEAEELNIVVLEKRRKLLGDDHHDTLHAMNNLAVTHHNLGRFEEAQKLCVVLLQKEQRLLGDDHQDTLNTMKYLANTYEHLGQTEEAEKLRAILLEKGKKL
ncbi:P-loop containing nucleoside triphosphate hydrolase protein [Mycena sanguinolenta]|nr:P-loop containing nucleoside triphosphate hydrolase protein [Mycena sanguinolenta]